MSNAPIATIHVAAIQHNLDLVRASAPGCRVLAMLKANAYGHGAAVLATRLAGLDAIGVARVNEGQALRDAGVELPIVVLEGFLSAEELQYCRQLNLHPTVHSQYQLDLMVAAGCTDLPIWLKLDSGMHRLGFAPRVFKQILASRQFRVDCAISHLANADQPAHPLNAQQLACFKTAVGTTGLARSLANSGAILALPETHFEWVRPGIMLYGSSPSGSVSANLQTSMTLTAPVLAVNPVAGGEAIGYGSYWVADRDTRVAVIGIGYADGYPREVPSDMPVLVEGQACPIVGRVSMDTLMVDVGELPVLPGSRVELWGENLPVDEVAARLDTIGYTLMSRLTDRVLRSYDDRQTLRRGD